MNKVELRRSLLKARQAIPTDVWRQKSDRIVAHLQGWSYFAQAKTVLAYFSFRQEPDLTPLFQISKQWGFPRCVEKSMTWHLWSPAEAQYSRTYPLQTGAYGILEPHPNSPQLEPEDVDLILVPSLACDVRGYRLGYGGGFYDRLLSSPRWSKKMAIGIVFEYARLPRLPVDTWDRPLSGICTESGLFVDKD